MAESGRWGRMMSRWGVRIMDRVVSAVAGRAVHTAPSESGEPLESAKKSTEVTAGATASSARPAAPAATQSAQGSVGDSTSSAPRAAPAATQYGQGSVEGSAHVEEAAVVAAMKSAEPEPSTATNSAQSAVDAETESPTDDEAPPTKSPRRRRRRRRKSTRREDTPSTKSNAPPTPGPGGKIVAVARDPEVAFVYWSYDADADAKLVWRAGDRTVRVERVRADSGKQYLPFVVPDVPHSATLEIGDDSVHSNTVRPPASAPRAAGPGVFLRPGDPQSVVLADRQRRDRAHLPTRPAQSPNVAPSSRPR